MADVPSADKCSTLVANEENATSTNSAGEGDGSATKNNHPPSHGMDIRRDFIETKSSLLAKGTFFTQS